MSVWTAWRIDARTVSARKWRRRLLWTFGVTGALAVLVGGTHWIKHVFAPLRTPDSASFRQDP